MSFEQKEADLVSDTYFVVCIHAIDGAGFKRQEWQEILYELAVCKMIKLIVTVDNVKAGVLFTDMSLDCYNFACLQMDTFEKFENEMTN